MAKAIVFEWVVVAEMPYVHVNAIPSVRQYVLDIANRERQQFVQRVDLGEVNRRADIGL